MRVRLWPTRNVAQMPLRSPRSMPGQGRRDSNRALPARSHSRYFWHPGSKLLPSDDRVAEGVSHVRKSTVRFDSVYIIFLPQDQQYIHKSSTPKKGYYPH